MNEHNKIEKLTDSLKDYVNARYELIELRASDKVSAIGSELVSGFLIGLMTFMFVIFISMAAGFYLSSLLGDRSSGFLIIAGIYLILTIILVLARKKIISRPIRTMIIKGIFKDEANG